MLEKKLREFVDDAFVEGPDDGELFWVEAGAGGTEGIADVFWPYLGKLLPVELKVFDQGFFLRPSQYSFHRNCAKANVPSFVVAFTDVFGDKEYCILILRGDRAAQYRGKKNVELVDMILDDSSNGKIVRDCEGKHKYWSAFRSSLVSCFVNYRCKQEDFVDF